MENTIDRLAAVRVTPFSRLQFLCHGGCEYAPGVHGADAEVNQATGGQYQPALFCKSSVTLLYIL